MKFLPVLLALSLTVVLCFASVIPNDEGKLELKAEVEAAPAIQTEDKSALKDEAKPAGKAAGKAEAEAKGKWGYPPQWYPAGGDVPPYPYNPNYDQSYNYGSCSWDPYFGYPPYCRQWMYGGRYNGRYNDRYNDRYYNGRYSPRYSNYFPYDGYRDNMMNNGGGQGGYFPMQPY